MIWSTEDKEAPENSYGGTPFHRAIRVIGVVVVAGVLVACVEEPPPPDTPTPTTPPVVTATPEVTPTTVSVVAPAELVTFRHKTGVFSISQPEDWEVIDESTDQRLSVRFIPPPGFGSRVTLDVTNEGVLTAEQLHQQAEGFVAPYVSATNPSAC